MTKKNNDTFEYNDEHCGGCGCGCDCNEDHDDVEDFEFEDMDEMDVIYLTLDDDTELECNVLGIFAVDEDEYIALAPVDDEQVLLYKYKDLGNDEFDLLPIEEEDEFEMVSEAFYSLFLDEDFEDEDDFVEYENYDDLDEEDDEE